VSPGRFLSLEGGEGAGKSTQALRLAEALERRGIEVVRTREPGGSDGAEAIRGLLLGGAVERWSAHSEALLFAAARADHVERTIRPALERGAWVVCDRFIDSTRAYQGAQGIDDAAILALHAFGSKGLLPDRTLMLELEPEEGEARATSRDGVAADRFAARGNPFHAAVRDTFHQIAEREADRVRLIDARGDVAEVTDRLLGAIADLLP
jgi:dTMP kinase